MADEGIKCNFDDVYAIKGLAVSEEDEAKLLPLLEDLEAGGTCVFHHTHYRFSFTQGCCCDRPQYSPGAVAYIQIPC